jgi:hypothetical protein
MRLEESYGYLHKFMHEGTNGYKMHYLQRDRLIRLHASLLHKWKVGYTMYKVFDGKELCSLNL